MLCVTSFLTMAPSFAVVPCLTLLYICFLYSAALDIGSYVFVNVSNAKISSKQYPKAQELVSHFDGRFAKIIGQAINSHNHSKWIIQSLHKTPSKLKVREQYLSFRSKQNIQIHSIPEASFVGREEYALWRELSMNTRDKFIVIGCDIHSSDEYDRILFSEVCQYEFAFQIAGEAQIILSDTNNSVAALKKIFLIKSAWMDSVYNLMIRRLKQAPYLRCFDFNLVSDFQLLHRRSWTKGNAVSRLFHKLCTECTSLAGYALAIVDDLRALEKAEDKFLAELLAMNDECRVAMTKDIIKMIDWRFHIYCNANKCHDLLWVAMAKEIIAQYYAHFDEFETLHVVVYYQKTTELMEMERMINETISTK